MLLIFVLRNVVSYYSQTIVDRLKEKIKNWRMIHMLYKFDIFNYYGTMQLLKKFIKFILRTLHNKWNINKLMNETCNQEIIMYLYMYVCISKYNN